MIPTSGDREHSTISPQSPALQDRDVSSTMPKSNTDGADVTVRSASLPQLTTKMPRSKVYRKTSLKSPSLKCEIDANSDGSGATERNGVVRYVSVAAEKKQKRRSLAEKNADSIATCENKWNSEDIHITCNPLSTPYPYSTPTATTTTTTTTTSKTTATTTIQSDEEPKSRSCGSFLPILALIPHSVISFQYLSPKMKFSWWRNKIS
ncbi:hypothetical protein P5V15_007845 [Pogonomyrmex californicus]